MFSENKYLVKAWPIVLIAVLWALESHAQMGFTIYPTEHQIKANFLYNFTRFVDWPEESFENPDSPYVIGIIGEDPFGIDLIKTVEGQRIKNREFIIKHIRNLDNLESCHILFIGVNSPSQRIQIIREIKNHNVLTVGDEKDFARNGGMIGFITKKQKVRFEINRDAVLRTRLKMSTKLLKMAEIIQPS